MIDSHCHLTFKQLANQLDKVISSAADCGVDRMITVGITPGDSLAAKKIAYKYENVFFSVGVHPHYAGQVDDDELSVISQLGSDKRCVAFGEMGVDYHYDDPPRADQLEFFEKQLQIVSDTGIDKPIITHCRKAVDDTIDIIRRSGIDGGRFVFHCFTEAADQVAKILDIGAMISFTGIVTYKNAPEVREASKLTPLNRIMIETDSPYLSPEPYRKVRPNQPCYVKAIAQFLAELRDESVENFISQTDANALRFFAWPPPPPEG